MTPRWGLGRHDVTALVGLLLLTAVIYHKAWLWGAVYFDSDIAWFYGPIYKYATDRLARGELPLWNAYLYGGTPFLPSPQTGTFYPPVWVGTLVPIHYAIALMVAGHVVLAGVLTYAFCRGALGVGALAAFCAAVAFAHGGFLASHYLQPAHVMSAAWMPGVLWAFLNGCTSMRRGWFVAGGAMLGASILAGGGQNVYLTCFAVVVACGCTCVATRGWRPLQGVAIVALVSAGVGMAQLLPTVRFLGESTRVGGYPYERASRSSAEPVESLVVMLCPHFFGHEGTQYWGSSYLGNVSSYLGASTLILGIGAVVLCRRQRHVVFLVVLAVVSLVMAWGVHTPIFPFTYRFVPGLRYFNSHGRFLQCFCLALAGLAAIGFEDVLGGMQPRAWRRYLVVAAIAWALAGFAAGFVLVREDTAHLLARLRISTSERQTESVRLKIAHIAAPHRSVRQHYAGLFAWTLLVWGLSIGFVSRICRGARARSLAVAIFPVLLAADLLMFNRGMLPWASAGEGMDYLQSRPWLEFLSTEGARTRWRTAVRWRPNTPALHRIATTDNYASYLPQKRHVDFVLRRNALDVERRWNELFAVRYAVVPAGEAPLEEIVYRVSDAPLVVHRIPEPLERFRLIYHTESAADATEALQRVFDPEFDPRASVVLEAAPSLSRRSVGVPSDRTVTLVREKPERLIVQVETPEEAYLVLSDAYFPGWRAWRNGVPTRIFRANYYFRAVRVPAGSSTVELRYVDRIIWLGAATSVLSLAGCLAWLCMAGFASSRERT